MAENYTPPDDWLGELKGSAEEAKKRIAADNKKRLEAGREPKSRILSVKDIQKGKWDADRILTTTLNGERREITAEDLKAFKQNISTAKDKFSKGISAQQVINHSRAIDRERANQQIKMAVPVSATKGKVKFITNAGGETPNVHRHHVVVEFLDFDKEAASGDTNARQSALRLRKSPLRIECDCGRWRFWYKYIATIGSYNAGTPENGYPKIRNSSLTGIACKHLLRVMHEITNGGSVIAFLANQIEKGKFDDLNRAQSRLSQKKAEEITKKQNKRTSTHELKVKEIAEKIKKAAEKAPKPKKEAPATKRVKPNTKSTDPYAQMRQVLKSMGSSDAQIEAMIAAHKATEGK